MPQEHAEIRGAASLFICRGHMTDRAVMTGASRDLAVLGDHLAVLGVLSRVIASSEAAVSPSQALPFVVAHGRY